MILPARHSFYLLGLLLITGVVVSIFPALSVIWWGMLILAALAWLADGIRALTLTPVNIERTVPGSLPVGVQREVTLRLHNDNQRALTLQVYDHHPHALQAEGLPLSLRIPTAHHATLRYLITAQQRGKQAFTHCQVRSLSPLRLWWRDHTHPLRSEVRVYPNFSAVAHYALMATDHHLSHLGIMKKRRRGEGQDFHQLREYRSGDTLRQIDWKATSRMRKAISREYQDERDQEIIFMLDSGHRMLAKDDALSHFDHTLNAILLLTYVALRQGDSVGLGTFGGTQRWLSPGKGQHTMQNMLNTLYDLEATPQAADYNQAVTELLVRQKKRALVIFITNIRDEDTDDLLPALHLLRKRHLVMLTSMRETAIDDALHTPVDNLEDALNSAAIQHYLQNRAHTIDQIRAAHIRCLDVIPTELSVNLINSYLDIKASGQL